MKTLKIFLPSIALLVVLALSITIGVYASTEIHFSVSSTISFDAPDVNVKVFCFINASENTLNDKQNYETNADYVWDSIDKDAQDWDLTEKKYADKLVFSPVKGSGDVAPIVITFMVQNYSKENGVYGCFVKPQTVDDITTYQKITADTIDGEKNQDILSVSFSDEKQVAVADATTNPTERFTMELSMANISKQDTATFNYKMYLSKEPYSQPV